MVISPCCINASSSNPKSALSPGMAGSTQISTTTTTSSSSKVRSEDELGRKLERCAADSLLKVGGGLAVGIIFSVLLFKSKLFF